jgi:O-antigen/teichoic acid export membrane protein
MDKAIKMGQDSASGSFWLFVGKIFSVILLAFGTIILGLFIGEDEYGLYAIALIPSVTLLLFQDWGVSSALTKYCAQFRGTHEEENLIQVIKAGLLFSIVSGLVLTAVSLGLADFLAVTVFKKADAATFIVIASSTLLSTSIMITAQSVFVGFEKMKYYSIVIICQASGQSTLSPLLVYAGYGTLGAILGYALSLIITAILALTMLYIGIFRILPKPKIKVKIVKTLKMLLNYGVPLGISTILAGIMVQFYSFMMAVYVAETLIGNYRMATNFAIFVTFFTVPISTVLFPAFSKIKPDSEKTLLKSVFNSSVKITALFILPATLGMVVLSEPIVTTLYGDRWAFASLFLSLSVLHNLFSFFGTLSINSLLTAVGETKMLMKLNILSIIVGLPLSFLIIPQYGVPGVILVSILALIPKVLIMVYWTWKKYGVVANFLNSTKLLIASGVSALITYIFLNFVTMSSWLQLLLGGLLFVIIYLFLVPLFGAVDYTAVCNLRVMFSRLGIVATILEIPLRIMSKIAKLREK